MPQPRPMREAAVRLAAWALLLALLPGAARAAGMPQLDFSTPLTISQVVWGALIFALLYFLLTSWALPRVDEVLRHRATVIEADLESARLAKLKADAAVAEMTETVGQARTQAQAAINGAVERAKQEAAAQSAVLNERLDTQLQAAERQIADARFSAMGALKQVASDTAATVIHRLTGIDPDRQRVEGAVGTVLAARQG